MRILHMMSGGRDSLLSAALQIEKQPETIFLLTCDNGCLHNINTVDKQVDKLIEVYNTNVDIDQLPKAKTALTFNSYLRKYNYQNADNLKESGFNKIKPYMINCMCCRLAMYTHAIAIAKVLGVEIISDGTRKDGGFITDEEDFIYHLRKLTDSYNIKLEYPIYDLNDNFKRKMMLSERRLPTKVTEPQCYLGMTPLDMDKQEINQYVDWFIVNIMNTMDKDIQRLINFYNISL